MSRFLVLTTHYLKKPTANGICAKNIVDAFCARGHEVDVVCFEDGNTQYPDREKYCEVHTVPSKNVVAFKNAFLRKLYGLYERVRSVTYPLYDRKLTANYLETSLRLCDGKGIDCVIAMFFPQESVRAVSQLKQKRPKIKTVLYELDSVGDGIISDDLYHKLMICAYERRSRKDYKEADTVIVMRSHEEYWMNRFGKKFGFKMKCADIPVLCERENRSLEPEQSRIPHFLYAGLIAKEYRSPEYLLNVFGAINQSTPFVFDFYSRGDCEEMIAKAAKDIHTIVQHGYVPQEELDIAVAQTDFLVSIGNACSKSVPSKLITYISYGIPIIHFSSQNNDICNEYLSKYPLSCIVNQAEPVEESSSKIRAFISQNIHKRVTNQVVRELYKENTPEFSAGLLSE